MDHMPGPLTLAGLEPYSSFDRPLGGCRASVTGASTARIEAIWLKSGDRGSRATRRVRIDVT